MSIIGMDNPDLNGVFPENGPVINGDAWKDLQRDSFHMTTGAGLDYVVSRIMGDGFQRSLGETDHDFRFRVLTALKAEHGGNEDSP